MSNSVKNFLDNSLKDILEAGRELFACRDKQEGQEVFDSIGKKMKRMGESAGRLNFKKIEEISNLLESIFYYAWTGKVSVDETFLKICRRGNNLCCDLLNSIKVSGIDENENFKLVVGDMMKYLELHIIAESVTDEGEVFDVFVDTVEIRERQEIQESPRSGNVAPVLILKSKQNSFCIHQKNIVSLEQANEKLFEHIRGMEFYRSKGEALPVVRLNKFFDLGECDNSSGMMAIVEDNNKRFCIVTGDISGHQEIAVEELDMGFLGQDIYSGIAMLDQRTVGLVINLEQLYRDSCQDHKIKDSCRKHEETVSAHKDENQMLVFCPENEKKLWCSPRFY